ncbi:hypothetical protein FOIG_11322 [Fusarium odoratissimum NRRL 54006]|uniref:Uncharacterized protein n=2 Tax=Fusarium oxysporum species complex TaxID=171631 RepID=X0J5F0_FUSO5|nr:uncharacterized protein FOIG_11322 [Fusarium odoratissimum NRRL 54006]EXL96362.1 hypothetical protein FOIG_11322 [Fusarium odoratissimum NRRL 54006]TXC00030.1 hypothetical protein FocTR4_00013726 [Fusarium oxysporum f. sp. cubense]
MAGIYVDEICTGKKIEPGYMKGTTEQCREFSDKRSQDDTSFPDLDLFDNTEWLYGAGILDQPERYDDPSTLQYFPNDGGEVMEHGHHLQINAEEPLSEKRLRSGPFFVDP